MTLLPGAECSQLLSLEKVTWRRSSSPRFSQRTPPPHHRRRYPPTSSTPLLSSQRSFSPAPIRLAQWGAVNSLRSANFQDGMPTPLSEARSGTAAFDFSLQVRKLRWEVGVGFAPQNFFLSGSDSAAFDVFTNSELR